MADKVSATENRVLAAAEQKVLASFNKVTVVDQYTASVDRQVRAALDTIARRRCKHGVHFNDDDMDTFLGILTKVKFETMSTHFVEVLRSVWKNECSKTIGKSNAVESNFPEKVLDLIVKFVKRLSTDEESYRNITIPPNSSVEYMLGILHSAAKVDVSVQSRYAIRVYRQAPVKVWAGVGGGVGIFWGVASGAALGASFGLAVPGVGNIVGAVMGGFAGLVGGGLAGAATGAGVGAIHSNVEHFTITAKEVFRELANFRDNGDNTVSCTLTINSTSKRCNFNSRPDDTPGLVTTY